MNRCGFTIPFCERAKSLYAFGYANKDIAIVLKNEFDDLEFRTIDHNIIRQLIGQNVKEFNAAKEGFELAVKAEAEAWMKHIFMMAQSSEQRIAQTYAEKIVQLCERLAGIDLSDVDAYSPSEIDLILSHIEKLQGLLGKIAGTEATRDVAVFKSKTEIKAAFLPNTPNNLIPMGNTKQTATKFIGE